MKKIFTLIFASILALATYAQDVIEVTFDSFTNEPEYNDGWEDWIINVENENYRFVFDFYGSD